MGGKASSNSQSFESVIKENQDDFIQELHQNKNLNPEVISPAMIKNLQNLKHLIIITEKLQTVQKIWNKIDFSVCIFEIADIPISLNQYLKCSFKSFSFGIIHLDPIECYHIIFFLNKSKIFLSTQEFLNRIILSSNLTDAKLYPLIMSRKSKPTTRTIKLEFPNPFLEPSIDPELLQSSSCAIFQKQQSDFEIDSDHSFQNFDNVTKNNFQRLKAQNSQPIIDNEESEQESVSLIIEEEVNDDNVIDSALKEVPVKKANSSKKKNTQTKRKSHRSFSEKTSVILNSPKKQDSLKLYDCKKDVDRHFDDEKLKKRSKKSLHSSKKNLHQKSNKAMHSPKNDIDHLSSLFNFSTAELSNVNQNKGNDICIDFYDQSSSINHMTTFKNWLPKNGTDENDKRKQRKSSILKNDTKNISSPPKSNKINQNKKVHINLNSDFDKSIILNSKNAKVATSSPQGKKKINKSSPQKKKPKSNLKSKSALGNLTSDFEIKSIESKHGSLLNFRHDFSFSYEEEDSSFETSHAINSRVLNFSLVNNTSKNINDNSNTSAFNENLTIHSSKIMKSDLNQKIEDNKRKIVGKKSKKKIINKQANNNGKANHMDSFSKSIEISDDGINKKSQMRIPRIYEKGNIMGNANTKFEQYASDFDLNTSSIKNENIYQNHDQNYQKQVLVSNNDFGQLASDFNASISSKRNLNQKTTQKSITQNLKSKIGSKSNKKNHKKKASRKNSTNVISDKKNKNAQSRSKSLDGSISQLNNSTDIITVQSHKKTIDNQNNSIRSSVPQKDLDLKNLIELPNASLGQLNSDFDMSLASNFTNYNFNETLDKLPSKNPHSPQRSRNQAKFVNNDFEEINFNHNWNTKPNQAFNENQSLSQKRRKKRQAKGKY